MVIDILNKEIDDLEIIYLFGSGTTDHYHDFSDVDLAIGMNKEALSLDTKLACLAKLENKLDRKVDLLNLFELDPGIKMEVMGKGQLLYAKDKNATRHMEVRALLEYLDLNDDRQGILNQIEKDGLIYG